MNVARSKLTDILWPFCLVTRFIVYVFFWVIPRRLTFIYRRFSNPVILHTHLPIKMEQTERSETSAYKIKTPGNYPEESISEHGESFKSRFFLFIQITY